MSEILFIAHRAPFPPDRGDKIRSHHVLRWLASHATVHLVAFADVARDLEVPPALRARLGECVIVPREKPRWRAAAEALRDGRPLSLAAFDDARVHAAVRDLLSRRSIDAVYAFSGQMAQYLPARGPRTVMDFVDADSAKFATFADGARGPLAWMYAREARMLGAFERRVATTHDAALFVSAPEAALVPGARLLENGIDAARFDPAAAFVPVMGQGRLVVFTGQMDYAPNVEAVTWFARDILPQVRATHPDVRFAIVGRAPTAAVKALASDAVLVTGEVPDVRGWLAAASAVVAPLKLARGIQNKVLEAMAMARPVVTSGAAAEGIDHAGTIRVADDADAFARTVIDMLDDPGSAKSIGAAAREQVIARYDWAATLAPLAQIVGIEAAAARVAA